MDVSQFLLSTIEYGPYISYWKVLILVAVLFGWARLLTWTDKDAEAAHLPREALNTGLLGGMIFAFLLFLTLPGFGLAISVLLAILVLEIAAYLMLRAQKIGLNDLWKDLSKSIKGGKSKKKEGKAAAAGELQLLSKKGVPYSPPDSESPEQAGYEAIQGMLTDPLKRGAERVEMRPTEGAASVKYSVDGVGYDGRAIPREDAGTAVTIIKQLAGLDLNDRRKPQSGLIKTMLDGAKREIQVHTAGSTAGETVMLDIEPKKRYELTIDQLGLLPEQLKLMEETIADGQGLVLLAAPRGHGLTSFEYATLRRHDAFLSHIQTVERETQADIEGVRQNKIPGGAGEEAKLIGWVVSQEPDILAVDRIEDPRSAAELVNLASSGRRAYVGLRAGSTFEAIQLWRQLVGDDRQALANVKLVVAMRLVRKLCPACKMDFNPDPDTLRKLNMPPERVGKLFTARTQPLKDGRGRDMVCQFCLDMKFKGRTGMFEMFSIDNEVRQVILGGGSVNQLKMLFKKQRQKYLQETALAVAVAGDTSLNEIARVLKAGEPSSGSKK